MNYFFGLFVMLILCIFCRGQIISPPPGWKNFKFLNFTKYFETFPNQTIAQTKPTESPARKGMTWKVKNWPLQENSWTGSIGCSGCDAYQGDTLCRQSLPLLCMINYKSVPRPFYKFPKQTTNAVEDGGFYNGWTGGYFSATQPISGTTLGSIEKANEICRKYFGESAQVAEHHMGLYLPYMNDKPIVGSEWSWRETQEGGWNAWGYFKGAIPCDKMWAWVNGQNANC